MIITQVFIRYNKSFSNFMIASDVLTF